MPDAEATDAQRTPIRIYLPPNKSGSILSEQTDDRHSHPLVFELEFVGLAEENRKLYLEQSAQV